MEQSYSSNPNNTEVPASDHSQYCATDTATGTVKTSYSLRSSDSRKSHPQAIPSNSVVKYSVKLPSVRKQRQPKIKKTTGKLKNKPGKQDAGKDLASTAKATGSLPEIEQEMQTMIIANSNQDTDAAFQFLSAIHKCIKEEENKASDTEIMDSEPFEEKEGGKENVIAKKSHLQAFRQKLLFSKENGLYQNQNINSSEITNTLDQTYINGDSEIISTPLAERLSVPINLAVMVNELEEVTNASSIPMKEKVEGLMQILENGFLSTTPPADVVIKSEPGVEKHQDMQQVLTTQKDFAKSSLIHICKSVDSELGTKLEELNELRARNKTLEQLVLKREQTLCWLKTLHADLRNTQYCHHTG